MVTRGVNQKIVLITGMKSRYNRSVQKISSFMINEVIEFINEKSEHNNPCNDLIFDGELDKEHKVR